MAKENPQNSASLLDEPRTQLVENFKERNDWVVARETVNCIYEEAAYQRIEASIPCDPADDKTRCRQEFLEMGAALIVDGWQREDSANNEQERNELDTIGRHLTAALARLETFEFSLSGAGQRLADATRKSTVRRHEMPTLVSTVRVLRDHCARAAENIPELKSGPKPLARPSVVRLLAFWRQQTGRSAHLALALLRYTGQRRADIVHFGRQHVRDGCLKFTQNKNRNRNPVQLDLPILPELQRVIDASPTGDLAFLVTEYGRPFTAAGFGNKFREWCNEAGLQHCSAHGLRKAAATSYAEAGASAHMLMAWFGWKSLRQPEHYTRAANQKKLAASVVPLLRRAKDGT